MKWKTPCACLAILLPLAGLAQQTSQTTILNKPFSAQQWTIYTSTLADGTTAQRAERVDISRSSDGSTRYDSRILSGAPQQWQATGSAFISIRNITNNLVVHLDTASTTARISLIKKNTSPSALQLTPQSAIPAGPPEPLGSRQIAGFSATGTRQQYTLPKGTAEPDQDVSLTVDVWYSTDLATNLSATTTDSRGNVTQMTLSQISTTEPSPSLFAIPSGYTVTTVTASASK